MSEFSANIAIIPTHQDVFDSPYKSIEQIRNEIRSYSSYAILHVCTKLMLLLDNEKAGSPDVQGSLAAELLDKDSVERLRTFLREHSDSRQQFFHHKSVLMLIKLNLESNDPKGQNIETKEDKALVASWLFSLTAHWIPSERIAKRGHKYFYEHLRLSMAQQYLQESNEQVINLIARGNYLLERVSAVEGLGFRKLFHESTGISVDLYIEILFMVMTHWVVDTGDIRLDDIAIRNTKQFFKNTKLKEEEIEAFMNIISFEAGEFKELHTQGLKNVKLDDTPDNFIAFIEKPILRYGYNFVCLSPMFLALNLTEGPYRIVESALKNKKNRNDSKKSVSGSVSSSLRQGIWMISFTGEQRSHGA
jgi:hypothetical protein